MKTIQSKRITKTNSATTKPNPADNAETVLFGSYAEENNLITIDTSAPSKPLPELGDDDISYREEREKIVTRAVNQSLAAAKALHEINTYRDGLLWRKEFRTFADYCQKRWGYQKSQAYRHVQAGAFLDKLEQADSPIGEKAGITETHLRPVLEIVPEDLQVDCWKWVAKQKPKNGKLTGAHVKKETERFLKKKGVEPKKKPKADKPDERAAARASVKRLEVDLGKLLPEDRYRQILEQILQIIDEEPGDGKSPEHSSKEVIASDRIQEKDPAPPAHDIVSSRGDEKAEGEALPDEKGGITAEIVAATMDAVAPPHEQSMDTAKLEKETTVHQRNLAVTKKCVRTATAESESQQDTANFMSAQLFHDFVHPGEDYAAWLDETAKSHPAHVRIPSDGGAASISLVRARDFAYQAGTCTDMNAFNLINEAQSSRNGNPGATADALFQHALAANESDTDETPE